MSCLYCPETVAYTKKKVKNAVFLVFSSAYQMSLMCGYILLKHV